MTAETDQRPAESRTAKVLHDAQETSLILAGAVTANWLIRKAGLGLIPHTRVGRFARWSDADIDQIVRENYCDPHNYGRKASQVRTARRK
jgi:hypothetical protein